MTDLTKALGAVLAIGIVQIFLVFYGHLVAGWSESTMSSVLFIALALYMVVLVWAVVRRVRTQKAHALRSSN